MAKLELILDYAENHTADITASTDAWTEMLDMMKYCLNSHAHEHTHVHAQERCSHLGN